MHRISSKIIFILFTVFMGMGGVGPFVSLKASVAQESPVPPDPAAPEPQSNDNNGFTGNDLTKYMYPRSGDLVSIGKDRIIEQDEVIESNVVVIGADLTVYGQINGDAVCIGGDLTIGPNAIINGDLMNVGGTLEVDPSARTYKDRVNVQDPFGVIKGMSNMDIRKIGGRFDLVAKILRIVMDLVYLVLLLFFALLLTTFMPGQFHNIEERLRNEFPKCVLLGIATMVGFPIIIIAFVITIVGIAAVPFLLLAGLLFSLTGYIVFSGILGGRLLPEKAIMLQILTALLLLHAPLIIGDFFLFPSWPLLSAIGHLFRVIGVILVFSINFIGLGAVVYALFTKREKAQS